MNESNMWKETDEEILQQIPEKLLTWYDKNARVLPWRENPQPYRVWVSEIMLQQTRVEAVKPYFERFESFTDCGGSGTGAGRTAPEAMGGSGLLQQSA